jgi:hypothetical protein
MRAPPKATLLQKRWCRATLSVASTFAPPLSKEASPQWLVPHLPAKWQRRPQARFRGHRSPHWRKMKNPEATAVKQQEGKRILVRLCGTFAVEHTRCTRVATTPLAASEQAREGYRQAPPRSSTSLGGAWPRAPKKNCVLNISGFLPREANRPRRCLMPSLRPLPSS